MEIHLDDLARPRLPFWLRAANRLAAPFAAGIDIRPGALVDAARREAGLRDFEDESFLPGLEAIARAVASEANPSPVGRFLFRRQVVGLLVQHLRIDEWIRRHPEILDEPIDRPIVIAGLPRTGTTHLMNCLARLPGLRWIPYWETLEPAPDPRRPSRRPADGSPRDPRVRRAARGLAFLDRVMPHFRAMHEFTPEGPNEEAYLLMMHFSALILEASYDVPSYPAWYRAADHRPAYRFLRRTLQLLQWLRGPKRWLLKSPQHLVHLPELAETFPGAFVVQTHRDPLRIVASLAVMIAYGRRVQTRPDAIDPARVGRHWAERVAEQLRASIEHRAALPEGRIFDVHFREFTKDNLATVERLCAWADVPFDAAARARLRAYLDESPRGRHGRIAYRLPDLGLDPAALREAFRFYCEHFGVAPETEPS